MTQFFYPSTSIWFKRIAHLAVLCSISVTIFLDRVEDRLLETTSYAVTLADTISSPIFSGATYIGTRVSDGLQAVEQSSYKHVLDYLRVPSSQCVDNQLYHLSTYQQELQRYGAALHLVLVVLKWVSIWFWVQIALSVFWLACDLRKGSAPVFVSLGLMVAIGLNLYGYIWLNNFYNNIFTR